MRVLLDECVPRQLKRELTDHYVRTVTEMGRSGIKNGPLLRRAAQEFDVFLTVDQGVEYQQNLVAVDLMVIVMSAKSNDIDGLAELVKVGWFKEPHLSVLLSADFRCEYCGQDLLASFNECFNAQLDHIHPKSKGGSEDTQNLAACCTTCNSLKWDYAPRGDNRDERIADTARYVREQRNVQGVMWNRYRELMRK